MTKKDYIKIMDKQRRAEVSAMKSLNSLFNQLGLNKRPKQKRAYYKTTINDTLKCIVCKAKFDYDMCIKIGKFNHCGKPMKHQRAYFLQ